MASTCFYSSHFQVDGLTTTTRLERRSDAVKDPHAVSEVHKGLMALVERLYEMVCEQKVIFDGHSALSGLACGLLTIVNSDIGAGFMENQSSSAADHPQFDFTSARVARESDSPQSDGTN